MKRMICVGLLLATSGVMVGAESADTHYSGVKTIQCPICGREFPKTSRFPHQGGCSAGASVNHVQKEPSNLIGLFQAIRFADSKAVSDALKRGAEFDAKAFEVLEVFPDLDVARNIIHLRPMLRSEVKKAIKPIAELL